MIVYCLEFKYCKVNKQKKAFRIIFRYTYSCNSHNSFQNNFVDNLRSSRHASVVRGWAGTSTGSGSGLWLSLDKVLGSDLFKHSLNLFKETVRVRAMS